MKVRILLLISLAIATTSCGRLIFNLTSPKTVEKDFKILYNKQKEKSIAFLPMRHVGKLEYFESARPIIDSLHNEGYIAFYEGVGFFKELDSLTKDTIQRKMRKLTGLHISPDYTDSTNKSLPNFIKNRKYAMQDYKVMGINRNDRHVDLGYPEIIRRYENVVKPIQLLPCDFETPLLADYKCKDSTTHSSLYALQNIRNDYLIEEIFKSEEDKILIIYGKAHWKYLWPSFRDSGYEIIVGKMFPGLFGVF